MNELNVGTLSRLIWQLDSLSMLSAKGLNWVQKRQYSSLWTTCFHLQVK